MKRIQKFVFNHHRRRLYLIYSIVFIIAFVVAYITFWKNDLSFIQHPDGYQQYYPKMLYIRQFWIDLINNFLEGNFSIPQFDLNIGLGEDVFVIMGAWIMDLPFSVLSVLFSEANFELYYAFNIVVKMYLAGLSFSYVCKQFGKSDYNVVIAAICYVFSGYLLRIAPMHPAYICPFILFPLVICGLDKILRNKKPYLFMFSFSMVLIRGYYFAYMITILIFIYGVIRYFNLYHERTVAHFLKIFFKAIGYYCIGFLMGILTFIPTIAAYFNSTRDSSQGFRGLLYSLDEYHEMLTRLIMPPGDYNFPALFAIVLPFLFLKFLSKKKESRLLRSLLIVCAVLALFPIFGRMMNGFGYPSNRWSFAFVFLAAYCLTNCLEDIQEMAEKYWKHILFITMIYNVIYVIYLIKEKSYENVLPLIILDCFVIYVIIKHFSPDKYCIRYTKGIVSLFIAVNLFVNGQMTFGGHFGNLAVEYSANETVNDSISQTTSNFDFKEYDSGLYRINSTNITNMNFSVVEELSTPSIYYSVINSAFPDFLAEIGSLSASANFSISGVDNRVQIESMLGVKYYITTDDTIQYLPSGMILKEDLENGYYLYENPYALPMVYMYDDYMLYEDFEKLNTLEKQEIMLNTAVVNEEKDVPRYTGSVERVDTSFEISSINGVNINTDGSLTVTQPDNYLELTIDRAEGPELYLAFEGIGINSADNPTTTINVSYGAVNKQIEISEKDYTWHYDNENPWINLGTYDDSEQTIIISFSQPGNYNLADIRIYQNPLDDLSEEIESRKSGIHSIIYDTNELKCSTDLENETIINFSVPYSEGWQLYIDGEETEIFKVNNLSIGAVVPAGEHDIELIYRTLYLKLAFCFTLLGWLLFVAVFIFKKKGIRS